MNGNHTPQDHTEAILLASGRPDLIAEANRPDCLDDLVIMKGLQDACEILCTKRPEVVGCKPIWKKILSAEDYLSQQVEDALKEVSDAV